MASQSSSRQFEAETEQALIDAYSAVIRKMYDTYFQSIFNANPAKIQEAGAAYQAGLALARRALQNMIELSK